MRRWHGETALMFRRWKMEMEDHRYDWRNPPTDPKACHCAKGIGSMRKNKPRDCGRARCHVCHWDKLLHGEHYDRGNRRRLAVEAALTEWE